MANFVLEVVELDDSNATEREHGREKVQKVGHLAEVDNIEDAQLQILHQREARALGTGRLELCRPKQPVPGD